MLISPILLVDDDKAFRERMARAIADRGHRPVAVGDIPAALASARRDRPNAAVVDLRLGDGARRDGLWLVRELPAIRTGIRVVVLTGFGSIATAIEAVRLGAVDYLTKPVDTDHLLRVLADGPFQKASAAEAPAEIPTLDRVEWEHIQRVLASCEGNISEAARRLGIYRRSLQRKLAKFAPAR